METPSKRRIPWPALAALAAAGLALAALAWFTLPVRDWLAHGGTIARDFLALVQQAGPWSYFGVFLILGSIGAPASVFLLGGSAAFGTAVGFVGGIGSILGIIVLSHFAAVWVARPLVTAVLGKFGYTIPVVTPANWRDFVILLRITPGIPFPVQNYLLPLAGVPLGFNLPWSLPIQAFYLSGFVFLGGSIFTGQVGKAVLGLVLIIAAAVGVRLFRSYRARRAAPSPTA